jgi:hypothetical protein
LPCGYPWVATQDASDRFLLPYHSTPSTRVSSTSAVVARLSPDAPTEDRALHDATFRFGGPLLSFRLRHRTAFSSVSAPEGPSLWHPCRLPRKRPWHFRAHEPFRGRRDRFSCPPVKGRSVHDPRCLPSLGDPALVPGRVSVTGTLGEEMPRNRGFATAARFSMPFRAQLPPPVREASVAS